MATIAHPPSTGEEAQRASLKPYVPRLLIGWLRNNPDLKHRQVEGSLAFVDISGFTKMTERLARKGKIGLEELNDILDATFGELLAVAYEDGAGLIKWGGDAVLLLFDGRGHAARAARAAGRMRRTLQRVGKTTSTAGKINLRMSVGIHSGVFDFFLAGDLHRELLICGPAASRTVEMESAAEAGDVLLSPEAAASIDVACLGVPKGGGTLVRRIPEVPFRPAELPPALDEAVLATALPLRVREHLMSGNAEAAHRWVAVAFVEVRGTDGFLQREGPDALADAVDATIRSIQHASADVGVTFLETDISLDGFKVLLVAGTPASTGDEAAAMLAATRKILDSGSRLPLRIGVNVGRVFSGIFGPPFRRTFSIKGDAVNLAARVMGKAQSGQALATAEALSVSTVAFDVTALEPFMVKGKRDPVYAFDVGPVQAFTAVEEAVGLPLVGRDEDVDRLATEWTEARGGRGRLLEVVGPAGIGKTRLLDELRSFAMNDRIVAAACDLYRSSIPYAPWQAVLRWVLEVDDDASVDVVASRLMDVVCRVAPDLAPWAPLLAFVLGVEMPPTREVAELDERFRKERIEETVDRFLEATLVEPVLVEFEDVHWMDELSAALLERVTSNLERRPWLICVSRRDEATGFIPDASAVTVSPEPLTNDAALRLLELATDDAPLRNDELTALVERADGNPLFLKELASVVRTEGLDELPDSIERMVAVQIDALSAEDRRLLRAAAVLGMRVDERLLAHVLETDGPTIDPHVWGRLGEFFTQDEPGFRRFRHALMRDSAYEGLPYRRRRELHARAGEAILADASDADEEAELLSLHFHSAQRFADAWRYSLIAGDRSNERYANVSALAFYRRALASAKQIGLERADRASILESIGDVEWRIGAFRDAAASFAASRSSVPDDPIRQANLLLKEAKIPYGAGSYTQAIRSIRKGMRILEPVNSPDAERCRIRLKALAAAIRSDQGRLSEAERLSMEVIAEAPAWELRQAVAHVYQTLDFVYFQRGRPELAVYSPKALAIQEERGDLYVQAEILNNMGINAYYQGHWSEAIDLYERSRDLRLRIGDAEGAAMATNNIAEIVSDQGRLNEAEGLFRDALRAFRAAGSGMMTGLAVGNLGRVASRQGRFDEAMPLLERSVVLLRDVGDHAQAIESETRIAELLLFEARWDDALAAGRQSLAKAEGMEGVGPQVPALYRIIGYAHAGRGEMVDARAALEASLATGRAREAEYEVAMTLRALSELFPHDAAWDAWRAEGEAMLRELGIESSRPVPIVSVAETIGTASKA